MPRQTNQIHIIMKRLFILIAIAFTMVACGNNSSNNNKQNTDNKTSTESTVSTTDASVELGKAFLENFYKGLEEVFDQDQEEAYQHVYKHVTPEAKQFLIDQYDYDCDGECMAIWLFLYQGGGDVIGDCQRTIEPVDGLSYKVTNTYYYEGKKSYEYHVKLGLVKDADTFKIDSITPEDEAYYD